MTHRPQKATAFLTWQVAPFDAKSIEMFRLMADKAGRAAHFYPLSMLTYEICPPPQQVRDHAEITHGDVRPTQ